MEDLIDRLIAAGYAPNIHNDAYDHECNRVYFDDNHLVVVMFSDPVTRSIVAKSTIDTNIGTDKVFKTLAALTE
jgi:hypothetical protein